MNESTPLMVESADKISDFNREGHIIVSEEEAGIRLDKLLSFRFPNFSRTYFQYLIESGGVLVNEEKWKKRHIPQSGDEIEICFLLTPEIKLEPEDIPLTIVYEDDEIIAINKPAGMVVHPAIGHPSHTFVNALLFHCKYLEKGDSLRPGVVHRLDKDTSGLLIAAKTQAMHSDLIELFATRQIKKNYLAICLGNPGHATLNAPIARHPVRRKEMAVVEGGKPSTTHCQTLKANAHLSLVNLKLITGRTHQIRVHMKHHGTPILGDPIYGSSSANQKYQVSRQMLHAHTLSFIHPRTKQEISLTATPPNDFLKWMNIFDM